MGLRDAGQMRQQITLGVTTGLSSSQQQPTCPGLTSLSFMVHSMNGESFEE